MSFWTFIAKRLAILLPTLFFVSVLIFSLQHMLPGDPAIALAGEESDPEVVEEIRKKYNLDKPIPVQYGLWLGKVLTGDFGISLRTQIEVSELILTKLPITLQLAAGSMLVALLIGIPAGIISATRKGKFSDAVSNFAALSFISIPNFWLGIMLILVFSVHLRWFPASGYVPLTDDVWRSFMSLFLPYIVLGTGVAGVMMRHTRGALLQTLGADYVRTARAKGLTEKVVVLKHALRNALVPVITLGAIEFGHLLSGAVLTEQIFSIPGFGKLIVDGILNRDYAVVQGVVIVSAALYILLNLLADIFYFLANPRMRG
jgi:peptide/nickel transport system permease protein